MVHLKRIEDTVERLENKTRLAETLVDIYQEQKAKGV